MLENLKAQAIHLSNQRGSNIPKITVTMYFDAGRSKNVIGQTEMESHLLTKFLLQWLPESGGAHNPPAHQCRGLCNIGTIQISFFLYSQ